MMPFWTGLEIIYMTGGNVSVQKVLIPTECRYLMVFGFRESWYNIQKSFNLEFKAPFNYRLFFIITAKM